MHRVGPAHMILRIVIHLLEKVHFPALETVSNMSPQNIDSIHDIHYKEICEWMQWCLILLWVDKPFDYYVKMHIIYIIIILNKGMDKWAV